MTGAEQWQASADGEGTDREAERVDPVLRVVGKQIKVLRERRG
ncbi:hypothetical protein [Streptomyces sp. DH37]